MKERKGNNNREKLQLILKVIAHIICNQSEIII